MTIGKVCVYVRGAAKHGLASINHCIGRMEQSLCTSAQMMASLPRPRPAPTPQWQATQFPFFNSHHRSLINHQCHDIMTVSTPWCIGLQCDISIPFMALFSRQQVMRSSGLALSPLQRNCHTQE